MKEEGSLQFCSDLLSLKVTTSGTSSDSNYIVLKGWDTITH